MIPRAHIVGWRTNAPWPEDAQVEQDLVITRTLVELFSDDFLSGRLAFRGGTALYKLFVEEPIRYSEDIDLVQRYPEAIGPTLDRIRERLRPWLGEASWDTGQRGTTLTYGFESEIEPVVPLKLKVEINTREQENLWPYESRLLEVENPWFTDSARITTFRLEELMGTKMRALYQRKQGRDLFDLGLVLRRDIAGPDDIAESFRHYLRLEETSISRAEYEENLRRKISDQEFLEDIDPLIATGTEFNPEESFNLVMEHLVSELEGDPWEGDVDDL